MGWASHVILPIPQRIILQNATGSENLFLTRNAWCASPSRDAFWKSVSTCITWWKWYRKSDPKVPHKVVQPLLVSKSVFKSVALCKIRRRGIKWSRESPANGLAETTGDWHKNARRNDSTSVPLLYTVGPVSRASESRLGNWRHLASECLKQSRAQKPIQQKVLFSKFEPSLKHPEDEHSTTELPRWYCYPKDCCLCS